MEDDIFLQMLERESYLQTPQAMCSQLDSAVFQLLVDLWFHNHRVMWGIKSTLQMLQDPQAPNPRLIVMATDPFTGQHCPRGQKGACPGPAREMLECIRVLAVERGVPLVHSLTRRSLGDACNLNRAVSVVCVTHMDARTGAGLDRVMRLAARAYAKYIFDTRVLMTNRLVTWLLEATPPVIDDVAASLPPLV
jgi:hypothetical protein